MLSAVHGVMRYACNTRKFRVEKSIPLNTDADSTAALLYNKHHEYEYSTSFPFPCHSAGSYRSVRIFVCRIFGARYVVCMC